MCGVTSPVATGLRPGLGWMLRTIRQGNPGRHGGRPLQWDTFIVMEYSGRPGSASVFSLNNLPGLYGREAAPPVFIPEDGQPGGYKSPP